MISDEQLYNSMDGKPFGHFELTWTREASLPGFYSMTKAEGKHGLSGAVLH
jgi:hypothetical protein